MSHKAAKRSRQRERRDRADMFRRFFGPLVETLQARYRARAREQHDRFPGMAPPCHTCAMNPATNDWQGADTTALRFLAALRNAQPFYCHDGAPFDPVEGWAVDPETAPLCSGFAVLAADREAAGAALREALAGISSARAARSLTDAEVDEYIDEIMAIAYGESA